MTKGRFKMLEEMINKENANMWINLDIDYVNQFDIWEENKMVENKNM